jgi:hypothetical protein
MGSASRDARDLLIKTHNSLVTALHNAPAAAPAGDFAWLLLTNTDYLVSAFEGLGILNKAVENLLILDLKIVEMINGQDSPDARP